jgi:hypothetical protein
MKRLTPKLLKPSCLAVALIVAFSTTAAAEDPPICGTPILATTTTSFCALLVPKACPKQLVQSEPVQAVLQCDRITGGVYCSAWPQACSATGALMYHYSVEINGHTTAIAPSSNPNFRRNCSQGSTITFSVLVQNGGASSSESQTVTCAGPID